jgi:hypothetical protein
VKLPWRGKRNPRQEIKSVKEEDRVHKRGGEMVVTEHD